ncbi:hypothetical protein AX16_010930 [Volvariella volvacea WC 439]|nr:hypothetical protein AX16_010930 [Volvariella volvacea WC 439]
MNHGQRISLVFDSLPTQIKSASDLHIGDVKREADIVRQIIGDDILDSDGGCSGGEADRFEAALRYGARFESLFHYALTTDVPGVPDDLRAVVVWALRMEHSISIQLLRAIRHDTSDLGGDSEAYMILAMTKRTKLAFHLMSPCINRPAEAARYLKESIDIREKLHQRGGDGEALMHINLGEFKSALEKALEEAERLVARDPENRLNAKIVFNAHVNLALVNRKLGFPKSVYGSHVDQAINFLKNHEDLIDDDELHELLVKPNFGEHPVLTKLGGGGGLQKLRNRTLSNPRLCGHCLGREPVVKLFRCGGCMILWYCSKSCQAESWKHHKIACRSIDKKQREIQDKWLTDAKAARFDKDFVKWNAMPQIIDQDVFVHALGLHRNPDRIKTHALFAEMEYNPASKDSTQKFVITSAAIYKVGEAARLMERLLGLGRGKATPQVEDIFKVHKAMCTGGFDGYIPTLCFLYNRDDSQGLNRVWVTCMVPPRRFKQIAYDPEWRKLINRKNPSKPLVWPNGPNDSEYIF